MRNSSWWRAAVRRSGESRSFAVAFGLGAAVGAPYALYTALSWATDFAARGATQAAAQDMQRNEQLRLGAQANKARLASLLAEFDPANAGKQNDSAQKDRWAQAMQGKVRPAPAHARAEPSGGMRGAARRDVTPPAPKGGGGWGGGGAACAARTTHRRVTDRHAAASWDQGRVRRTARAAPGAPQVWAAARSHVASDAPPPSHLPRDQFAARGERAGMQLGETEPRLVYGNKGSKKGAQADCEGAKPSRWRAWLGGRGEAGSEAAQKA